MYIPTIGLEIHTELKTKTKMFCGCKNDGDERRPNVNVCPICLGHPGTLPTINKQAVLNVIKVGLTLDGQIPEESHFDRKSYFYPDLPKGYQISQYEKPLVEHGLLNGIRITRIHLEEDAGRLVHELGGMNNELENGKIGNHNSKFKIQNSSLVDFNRAGVPLMELVTEPDIKNANEAAAFAQELQLLLRYLGVSDADMEKGQMRIEANVSLMHTDVPRISQIPHGKEREYIRDISGQFVNIRELGNKVEVKNINSFKAVHDAIEYEIKRQKKILSEGKKVTQETRGWNDKKFVTESQRSKEEANDYRYFPEPDLPPLDLKTAFDLGKIKAEIPELPEAKRRRFGAEFGLDMKLVETIVADKLWADYFEQAVSELKSEVENADVQLLANYFTSDLKSLIKTEDLTPTGLKITPDNFADLIALIQKGKISSRIAKDLLLKMFETGEDPETLIQSQGMGLMNDEGELGKVIEEVLAANGKSVADFKKGKTNALQFLLGQVMAKTKGKADPNIAKKILERILTDIRQKFYRNTV